MPDSHIDLVFCAAVWCANMFCILNIPLVCNLILLLILLWQRLQILGELVGRIDRIYIYKYIYMGLGLALTVNVLLCVFGSGDVCGIQVCSSHLCNSDAFYE